MRPSQPFHQQFSASLPPQLLNETSHHQGYSVFVNGEEAILTITGIHPSNAAQSGYLPPMCNVLWNQSEILCMAALHFTKTPQTFVPIVYSNFTGLCYDYNNGQQLNSQPIPNPPRAQQPPENHPVVLPVTNFVSNGNGLPNLNAALLPPIPAQPPVQPATPVAHGSGESNLSLLYSPFLELIDETADRNSERAENAKKTLETTLLDNQHGLLQKVWNQKLDRKLIELKTLVDATAAGNTESQKLLKKKLGSLLSKIFLLLSQGSNYPDVLQNNTMRLHAMLTMVDDIAKKNTEEAAQKLKTALSLLLREYHAPKIIQQQDMLEELIGHTIEKGTEAEQRQQAEAARNRLKIACQALAEKYQQRLTPPATFHPFPAKDKLPPFEDIPKDAPTRDFKFLFVGKMPFTIDPRTVAWVVKKFGGATAVFDVTIIEQRNPLTGVIQPKGCAYVLVRVGDAAMIPSLMHHTMTLSSDGVNKFSGPFGDFVCELARTLVTDYNLSVKLEKQRGEERQRLVNNPEAPEAQTTITTTTVVTTATKVGMFPPAPGSNEEKTLNHKAAPFIPPSARRGNT